MSLDTSTEIGRKVSNETSLHATGGAEAKGDIRPYHHHCSDPDNECYINPSNPRPFVSPDRNLIIEKGETMRWHFRVGRGVDPKVGQLSVISDGNPTLKAALVVPGDYRLELKRIVREPIEFGYQNFGGDSSISIFKIPNSDEYAAWIEAVSGDSRPYILDYPTMKLEITNANSGTADAKIEDIVLQTAPSKDDVIKDPRTIKDLE